MRSQMNRFFSPSLRGRITASFVIVIVLVLISAAVNFLELRQVQPYSGVIIATSLDMSYLQRMIAATSDLDADMGRYLATGVVEYQEKIQQHVQELEDTMRLLKTSPRAMGSSELQDLRSAIQRLSSQVQFILEAESTHAAKKDVDWQIEAYNNDIIVARTHQDDLLARTLNELQASAQVQGQIAANVLLLSTILGVIVIATAVVTSLISDRRLRGITRLTNTTSAIAAGDLMRVAPVESNDEIGTLAGSINAMTNRLREMVATLEQRVADRTRAIETTSEISRRLSTILDQKQLALAVVEEVQRAFNYYHAHIYLYEEMEENLVMVGGTGEAGQLMLGRGHSIVRGRGLVGRAADTNQVVLVPDTQADPTWLPNPLLPDTKSEVAVPISAGGRVLGVLDVQHHVVNGLTQQDVDLLQSIANQVGVAVQNANLFTQTQRQADRELMVNTIGQKIQTATSVEGVLQVLARELGAALKTQRVLVQVGGVSASADTGHPADSIYHADIDHPWAEPERLWKG